MMDAELYLGVREGPVKHRTTAHVAAVVKKNWAWKKRTPLATCCEAFLPTAFVWILAVVVMRTGDMTTVVPEQVPHYDVSAPEEYSPYGAGWQNGRAVAMPTLEEYAMQTSDLQRWSFSSGRRVEFAAAGADCADVARLVASMEAQSPAFAARRRLGRPSPRHCAPGVWASEADLVEEALDAAEGHFLWAAIIVREADYAARRLDVGIRMNNSAVPPTLPAEVGGRPRRLQLGGDSPAGQYAMNGFLVLQEGLAAAFFGEGNASALAAKARPLLLPMPQAGFVKSVFYESASRVIPLMLVLSFMYLTSRLVALLVKEKELKQREAMHIMGLSKGAFYGGWYLTYLGIVTVSTLCSTVAGLYLFPHASPVHTFLVFELAALSAVSVAVLVSTLFTNARLAASVGATATMVLALPYLALQGKLTGTAVRWLCLIPHTAFTIALQILCDGETSKRRVGLTEASAAGEGASLAFCLFMLVVDIGGYFLLAWYLDAVLPSSIGAKRHPLYCLPSFRSASFLRVAGDPDHVTPRPVVLEPQAGGVPGIQIQRLTKHYEGMDHPAVDALGTGLPLSTLAFPAGSIQVILGHNGAGKTTLINMLTGMTRPDSGDCTVFGQSILKDMDGIRENLGLCPQHNIIWPDLTCEEHLLFYGRLKGPEERTLKLSIVHMLSLLGMSDKATTLAGALSGGQKRKLSVAAALIGGPRVVVLDEPTAGMDAGSRRAMWRLLRRPEILQGRVVLLTTHYMDEADVLGDAVTIMDKGHLHSFGSPFYLKQKLGAGYNLTVALQQGGDTDAVTRLVTDAVPGAKFVSASGNELRLQLPLYHAVGAAAVEGCAGVPEDVRGEWLLADPAVRAERMAAYLKDGGVGNGVHDVVEGARAQGMFPALFDALEVGKDALMVESFGVGLVTLQEIFLDIASGSATAADAESPGSRPPLESVALYDGAFAAGLPFLWQQFKALFMKRLRVATRDSKVVRFQLLYPVLFIAISLLLLRTKLPNLPDHALDGSTYHHPSVDVVAAAPALWAACTLSVEACPGWAWRAVPGADVHDMHAHLLAEADSHAGEDKIFAVTEGNGVNSRFGAALHVNFTHPHALPTAVGAWLNRLYVDPSRGERFRSTTHPLPYSRARVAEHGKMMSFIKTLCFIMAFAYLPQAFIMHPVREREEQVKAQLLVSGTRLSTYWGANFAFDVSALCTTLVAITAAIYAFGDSNTFLNSRTFSAYVGLCIAWGGATIASSYAASFAFDKATTAQSIWGTANMMVASMLVTTSFILDMFESTAGTNAALKNIYMLVPSFCLGNGLLKLSLLTSFGTIPTAAGATGPLTPWDWGVIGKEVAFCAFMAPCYLVLVFAFEANWGARLCRRCLDGGDDKGGAVEAPRPPDVEAERTAILSDDPPACSVVAKRLTKRFRKGLTAGTVAVDNLTVGVRRGELFAFLGTNGAGKTTTISMLAGGVTPTSGEAAVDGYNVATQRRCARQRIGLCPQFDALMAELTPDEHLMFYGALRGLPSDAVQRSADDLIAAFGLAPHRAKRSSTLSGGNKRKLSVAVALIGGPSVVILDEPSAGMDPAARRALWGALEGVCRERSVLLTTHHLEEVEGLAHLPHRVGIMKDARLQCLGSLQQLKARHGEAYELTLSLVDAGKAAEAKAFVERAFPAAALVEEAHHRVTYSIPLPLSLSAAFRTVEENRGPVGVGDYSLSEMTLEQVFLGVTGARGEEAARATSEGDDSAPLLGRGGLHPLRMPS